MLRGLRTFLRINLEGLYATEIDGNKYQNRELPRSKGAWPPKVLAPRGPPHPFVDVWVAVETKTMVDEFN